MNSPNLGIDLAQATFVAALSFDQKRFIKAEFPNHGGGFRQLRRWLKQHGAGPVKAGLESTNTYGEALAQYLHDQGHCVYLLNPERVACYARAKGQRNKTDPADAALIAVFTAQHEGTPWHPPTPEQKTLRSLTRTRHQLVACQTQLRQQLRTADALSRSHLEPVLEAVRQQLLAIGRALTVHLREHPQLGEQVQRLQTVKGVGLVTAAIALAELPPITPQSDPRALCAWAGLVPRRWQSGKTELPARLSRKGNVYLREALYMPALVAKRYNPLFQAFAARLKANGKSSGAILGAIAHKMLRILIGLLKTKTDFDPNWAPKKS